MLVSLMTNRRFAVAALAFCLTAAAAAQTGAQSMTPQQIFNAAFRRLQSYPIPPYAVWTTTWHIRERPMGYYTGERSDVEVHRYAVRLLDGMENLSDPRADGKLPPALIGPEFVGPFAWRMRSSVRVPSAQNGINMTPDIEGLKTIATVVAVAQSPYAIVLDRSGSIPIENVNGHLAYHLELRPRNAPERHNLRDLWIDSRTYDVWKLHFVGTYSPFGGAPASATDAVVEFRNVLGCWVVTRAAWNWDDAPMRFFYDVQNDEIGMPESLPYWLFDAKAYRARELAGESDYLGAVLARLRAAASPTPSARST
jgi:hypothetical protein